MAAERHSVAATPELLRDPAEKAEREAENGIRQFNLAIDMIKTHVIDDERPFRLRSSSLLKLNQVALDGIHAFAGTYRNGSVKIHGSGHQPPEAFLVAELIEEMCAYVNDNWNNKSPIHLGAYAMWRLNWIHPFADGNGRTSRAASYVIMSIRAKSLFPGSPTIPEQISENKTPYYDALEAADKAWEKEKSIDVSEMEKILQSTLASQLLYATEAARNMSEK